MRNSKLHILIILVIAILPFSAASAKKCKKSFEVIILHTNDMHSKIDNMGKLAYLVDSIKTQHPHVFLFSAGDNFTGNPIVDMYPEKGYPMIDLMNRVGFDLSAMGNHEFDLGQETQNKRRSEARFPFISANINVGKSILKKPAPYYLLQVEKCKIPVFSLIQVSENGYPDSHPSRLEGLSFDQPEKKAAEYMKLKKKYGMLIALTHLGIETDVPLAQKYPQIDLIIGGHSHTVMTTPLIENGVMIVQTGSQLKSVGKTTFQVVNGKITDRKYELISLASITHSKPEIQNLIDRYNDNEEMNRVLASAGTPLNNQQELGCLMTDAITSQFKVDFAFQNTGGIRIPYLPKGDILYKDIFRLDPFGNQVVTYTMTLLEVKSLIMNAYNRNKEPDLMVSGMKYSALVDQNGVCTDVVMTDYSGNPFDPSRKYTVGMNSYIGATYVFDHTDPGTTNFDTTAQTLINFLKEVKSVSYEGTNRIEIKKK
jgi:2',3'-cyclic-nucleotide 2'-phosphodiesterase (5'-nucleotidase family)